MTFISKFPPLALNRTKICNKNIFRLFHVTRKLNYAGCGKDPVPCTLIEGEGVGPELICNVLQVLEALEVPILFEKKKLSEACPDASDPLDEVVKSIKKNKVCLMGCIQSPLKWQGDLMTLNMKFRKQLDLYANVVPIRALPGLKIRHPKLDIAVIREQTEGEYSALEHEAVKGVTECLKIITRKNSERIARFAFDYAVINCRKKVTCVHKANIMKISDGLFMKTCEDVAKCYKEIKFEKMIVDNTTMQMTSKPEQFDVLVMPNLYGNIVGNLGAGLIGGAGVVPGVSYSDDCAVFQPGARHTFKAAVGKDIANPTAMLLCAAHLLYHIKMPDKGQQIIDAVCDVLLEGRLKTRDVGGCAKTSEFMKAIMSKVKCTCC